jgi:hypothetical protein
MSFHHSPKIVTDGLVFCIDPANSKSYSTGSTCKDLTLKNGIGTLTDVTLSADKGFLMSAEATSKVKFTRGFTNITNSVTYMVVTETPIIPDGYTPALLSSANISIGGIYLICYGDGTNVVVDFYTATDDGANGYETIYPIPKNSWKGKYIITGTISPSIIKLYVNGLLVTTTVNGYNFNNQSYINIGYDDQGGIFTYPGVKIYQSMIYNRPLTDAEVLQNYNALKGKYKL